MAPYAYSIPTPPTVLSKAEQDAILKVTGEHRDGFRDHMIIAVALGTGLRAHEIAALDVENVRADSGRIRRRFILKVFKRASEEPALQEVFFSERLRVKLERFLAWKEKRGERVDAAAPVFVSRKGNRISGRRLRTLFRKWQERAGFERLYNFHVLRHTAISNVYNHCKDIRLTQRFARHKSVLSTQRYAHAPLEELVGAVQGLTC